MLKRDRSTMYKQLYKDFSLVLFTADGILSVDSSALEMMTIKTFDFLGEYDNDYDVSSGSQFTCSTNICVYLSVAG